MLNRKLKDYVLSHLLPHVQTPAQYLGGELNAVVKDHRAVRGRLCLAFPDTYTLGSSHHGTQVLYSLMNDREHWACERAFTPWPDMEALMRRHRVPLYSLETFTPLSQFDVVGLSLQYEVSYTNILTLLDLGGIPLYAADRTADDPLVIAGGPCAQNPEPLAPYVDLFVCGDGEPSLPAICDMWIEMKGTRGRRDAETPKGRDGQRHKRRRLSVGFSIDPETLLSMAGGSGGKVFGLWDTEGSEALHRPANLPTKTHAGGPSRRTNQHSPPTYHQPPLTTSDFLAAGPDRWNVTRPHCDRQREDMLAALARELPYAYVPRFYEPEYHADGTYAALHRTRSDVPERIAACVIDDLEAIPVPTRPIVPYIDCVHDRIAIEIMRGCPWQCRFCQSTVIKRPLRVRSVECIVQAALAAYRNTGTNEVGLLSLSSSDYPYFEQLVRRMHEVFGPLGVNISLPSLRVNEQFRSVPKLMAGARHSGLTLAPEVARDDMREQIRKKIKNDDLYDGCRAAFAQGWRRVKLYFMCGLPGERPVDLDGIVEMADTIAKIGRELRGRDADVTASVSNFVPKPHTPYQWNGMQTRDYFRWAHDYLHDRRRNHAAPSVRVKCHDVETSLLEGILTRGDRRIAPAIELAWRRGARLDAWTECFNPSRWWQAFADLGIDLAFFTHRERPMDELLPWDHVNVKYGRAFLEKEQRRAKVQLAAMAGAV